MLQNITTVKRSGSNFFYSLIHCFVFAAAAPSIHSFSKFARPLPISLRLDRWATKEGLTLNAVIATSDRQILHSTPWINNTWLEVNSLSVKRCTQWQTALALTRCKKQPDNPPVCPDVTLSLSASLSHHANSLVHVTVAEDDERRLSSQLQRHLLQVTDGTAATGNHREEKKAWSFTWQSRQPGEQLAELVWSYLFMICLPIGVEPVKPSLRMSGWSDKRCPTMPPAGKKGIGEVGYRSMTKRKV